MRSKQVTTIGELIVKGDLDLSKINTHDHGRVGGWNLIDNKNNNKGEKKMKYRKKPVVIEAFQYDGDLMNSRGEYYAPDWAVKAFKEGVIYYDSLKSNEPPCELFIKTLEGVHHVSVSDYIIQGVNGELYPCKPDIFEKTYDLAE